MLEVEIEERGAKWPLQSAGPAPAEKLFSATLLEFPLAKLLLCCWPNFQSKVSHLHSVHRVCTVGLNSAARLSFLPSAAFPDVNIGPAEFASVFEAAADEKSL